MPSRKRTEKVSPVARLVAAMDRCAVARSNASWTQGYRSREKNKVEEARLYAKELVLWRTVTNADLAFTRLAQRVIREARKAR